MFAPFRHRNYRIFWTGSFVSNVGTWMHSMALGWLLYEMTSSATWLGLVAFASQAPTLFLGPFAGAIADRADRKTILVVSQAAAAGFAAALAILTAAGVVEIWHVVVLAIAAGVATSFFMPVVQAMLPSLVPGEVLLPAISLNAVSFNLARLVGPIVAGFAYAFVGPTGCFAANAASFLVLVGALRFLDLEPRPSPSRTSLWTEVRDGFGYARSERRIFATLCLASGLSLFGFPYIILMPAFARDVLGSGPRELGLLMGSMGLGAVLGGLTLAALGDVRRKGLVAVTFASALALLLVGFSAVDSLPVALATLFCLGSVQIVSTASLNVTLQVLVTDSMRGRIMGLLTLSFFGLSTGGSVVLGALGDVIGVRDAIALGGVAVLVVAAGVAVQVPELLTETVRGRRPANVSSR